MPKVARMMSFRPTISALAQTLAVACAASLACSSLAEARTHHGGRALGEPVVVELFTAQGCSTCPKANGVIGDLMARKGVLPLTFSVDYWDYLGWEDTLAKSEFSARQRAYAQRMKVREIYTPEIVVGGAAESPALDQKKIGGLIAAAQDRHRRGPHIRFYRRGARVSVSGSAAEGQGEVWLIRYDPAPQTVKVKAGENRGQSVTVRNAVRELKRLGPWRGAAKTYVAPPAEDPGLKTVVIVQAPKGGRILASAKG